MESHYRHVEFRGSTLVEPPDLLNGELPPEEVRVGQSEEVRVAQCQVAQRWRVKELQNAETLFHIIFFFFFSG